MNAVEIEQAISDLAFAPFDAAEFPFAFLAAFGNKDTTLKRLRAGNNNTSDIAGGVLLRNHIHIAVCAADGRDSVGDTLSALRASPATAKAKAKFILATDGQTLQAQELVSAGLAGGETIACDYADLPNHFGFLLPLAGISTIQEIKDNPIDVRATGRLNKLYVELLTENPSWAKPERRADMNHFMARLIFCFFAEDTDIFNGEGLFTQTVMHFSEPSGSNTHEVLSEIFRAMNTKAAERAVLEPRLPNWANGFPYVNGGLFSGSTEVPRFTRMARTYLQHAGTLNWRQINPDIFGSMIQAVADDEERGALGMHYTSVPNILKVLNPLFLDELRAALQDAGSNARMLLNLRKRMARIRVFDPACGSGNFLVIAYKQMREIEALINQRRGESSLGSEIPLTNFRGIELRDFPAEIARLALIIAEFQCDVLYRGQKDALAEFLPLNTQNWIVCGNALRLDWLSICPPTGTGVQLLGDDLFNTPLDQSEIEFENEGGETYICGNPPYKGSSYQTTDQKSDLETLFKNKVKSWKNLDYIAGWFSKASDYIAHTEGKFSFVSTNSICQGQQVPMLWPLIFDDGNAIVFAHTSFKWSNLASKNAGVTVVIVGVGCMPVSSGRIFSTDLEGNQTVQEVSTINSYLIRGGDSIVEPSRISLGGLGGMVKGNQPSDGGHLCLAKDERDALVEATPNAKKFIKRYLGSEDFIQGKERYCLWIKDSDVAEARSIGEIEKRLGLVADMRRNAKAPTTRPAAAWPHRFIQIQAIAQDYAIIAPRVSSERREYLPVGLVGGDAIISDSALAIYDAPIWNLSVIASRLHLVWVATVCGKLETRYRYSNTLGWNTFPVPLLTEQNQIDLTRGAEAILLAREAHFPATIADLYDPATMPANLRAAHEHNDEVLERIYIGRRFKNDTERLEKLFELYTKMTAAASKSTPAKKAARRIKA